MEIMGLKSSSAKEKNLQIWMPLLPGDLLPTSDRVRIHHALILQK